MAGALLLFFLLKLFIIDIVRVNSRDMCDTYGEGAALLLNKTAARFERGEIICFRFPSPDGKEGENSIQRLTGLPGDTLEIKDKQVFINGNREVEISELRFNYFVRFKSRPDSVFLLKYNLTEGGSVSGNNEYSFTLNRAEADSLKRDSLVQSVEVKLEKPLVFNESTFPNSPAYAWNPDNFGKIYIPAKGDTLRLDSTNIELYETIITVFEKNKLFKQNDSIFINDVMQNSYVVKQDYFFVMGDNRDNAVDSRYFGFLPKHLIRGRISGTIRQGRK